MRLEGDDDCRRLFCFGPPEHVPDERLVTPVYSVEGADRDDARAGIHRIAPCPSWSTTEGCQALRFRTATATSRPSS